MYIINKIIRTLRFLWNCMCYAEGVNGWMQLAESGAITPQEYCVIEKRLYTKYIEGGG